MRFFKPTIVYFRIVSYRPISASRYWPLYGDEYGRIKFGKDAQVLDLFDDFGIGLRINFIAIRPVSMEIWN